MSIWFLTDERYLRQRMPGAVISWLQSHGHRAVRLLVVEQTRIRTDGARIDWPLEEFAEGDVVVSRSRHPLALTLLSAASRRGFDVVTPWHAVDSVRDKARCVELLTDEGIPTPGSILTANVTDLAALGDDWFPLLLKPHLGNNAQGLVVVENRAALCDVRWNDGLVLAQRWAETGGWDVKLYICDDRVWAVRRRSPLAVGPARGDDVRLLPVDDDLRVIARSCRDLFGLPLCGVDVLMSDAGPLVVDVNDFPNYTGVADAAAVIGSFLVGRSALAGAGHHAAVPAGEAVAV